MVQNAQKKLQQGPTTFRRNELSIMMPATWPASASQAQHEQQGLIVQQVSRQEAPA